MGKRGWPQFNLWWWLLLSSNSQKLLQSQCQGKFFHNISNSETKYSIALFPNLKYDYWFPSIFCLSRQFSTESIPSQISLTRRTRQFSLGNWWTSHDVLLILLEINFRLVLWRLRTDWQKISTSYSSVIDWLLLFVVLDTRDGSLCKERGSKALAGNRTGRILWSFNARKISVQPEYICSTSWNWLHQKPSSSWSGFCFSSHLCRLLVSVQHTNILSYMWLCIYVLTASFDDAGFLNRSLMPILPSSNHGCKPT